ncbi:amino acid ABC transporter substrate-binding protein [Paenibacillus filicis]|uniref:Amino acid ABC transporter substrate-binding protein n=1 Tax=Paenibacillus filicis TaxID=669464 RepID=A0ABU9DG08_9BACL
MNIRLFPLVLIPALLLMSACGAKQSEPAKPAAASPTPAAAAKTIKVGGQPDSYPYTFKEGNEIKGFNVDIVNAITSQAGYKVEWSLADWNGIVGQLEVGKIDTVRNFAITDERKQKFNFTKPYSFSGAQLLVKKDNNTIQSLKDMKGKKVGAALGQNYANVLKENDPAGEIQLITYETQEVAYKDLEAGRIDAYVAGRESLLVQIKEKSLPFKLAGEPFGEKAVAFPFHKTKENDAIIADFDKAIDDLRSKGKLKEIAEKWFGGDITESGSSKK